MTEYRRHDVAWQCPRCGAAVLATLVTPAGDPPPRVRFAHHADGSHRPTIRGRGPAAAPTVPMGTYRKVLTDD